MTWPTVAATTALIVAALLGFWLIVAVGCGLWLIGWLRATDQLDDDTHDSDTCPWCRGEGCD